MSETVTARLTYTGRRLKSGGGLAYRYRREATGDLYVFAKNLRSGTPIGATLEVQETPSGVLAEGRRVIAEQLATTEEIAEWSAAEAADVVLHERELQSRRSARQVETPLDDALQTLADAYGKLSGIGRRAAFIDYVSAAIQGARR